MKVVKVSSRDGEELVDYKTALKKLKKHLKGAKESLDVICELSDDMEEEYSSRGSMRRMKRYMRSMEDDEMEDD